MEQYYFIQLKGVKKGPFKLDELKSQNIYFDELVWRSDDDKWKKASEYEELSPFLIINPPLTPVEIEKDILNKEFSRKIIPNLLWIYFIVFLIITFSSYTIALNSWDEARKPYIINKDDVGKPSYNVIENKINDLEKELNDKINEINNLEIEIKSAKKNNFNFREIDVLNYRCFKAKQDSSFINIRIDGNKQELTFGTNSNQSLIKPIYKIPDEVLASENINGLQQPFLIRPLNAYFSKIYLTREEQNSSAILFKNLALGTFLFLSILLIITLAVYYYTKISNFKQN